MRMMGSDIAWMNRATAGLSVWVRVSGSFAY
jgi:hypothetical protein